MSFCVDVNVKIWCMSEFESGRSKYLNTRQNPIPFLHRRMNKKDLKTDLLSAVWLLISGICLFVESVISSYFYLFYYYYFVFHVELM